MESECIKARKRLQILRCADELLQMLDECYEPDFVAHVCDIVTNRKLKQQELEELDKIVGEYEMKQLDDYLERLHRAHNE